MRSIGRAIRLVVLLTLAGCGSSGHEPTGPAPPSPSGLDSRPDNTTCIARDRPVPAEITAELVRVFPALSFRQPVLALQPPADGSRWFVVEQAGSVWTFENVDSVSASSLFVDLSARIRSGDELGLLGFAFDPAFAANGRVFVHYTRETGQLESVLSSYTSADGGATLDPASERILLTIRQPFANHKGGHLAFGRDGMLYMALGDGGSAGDPMMNAQNTRNLLGKILRLDVSGGDDYAIPPTNRFAGNARCTNGEGAAGCPEIFALGLHDPRRFSFDSGTGALWAGDISQNGREEVNRIQNGGNYGWNIRDGMHCLSGDDCPPVHGGDSLQFPEATYGQDIGTSITGGVVYRGNGTREMTGQYVFGDFDSGRILAHSLNLRAPPRVLLDSPLAISAFAEGIDGEIYVVDHGGGLYRLDAAATGGSSDIPFRLSETGCIDTADPSKPGNGLIPFRINTVLWSDGAAKERWIGLPNGGSIAVDADGDWQFPPGTVMVKKFSLGDQPVETRLFMRHPDGSWAGYTYEWNEEGTDATRVLGGKRRRFGDQDWVYPNESDCLRCHTDVAGRTLGPETAQLNGEYRYPQTGRTANQLTTLDAIGVFRPPLDDDTDSRPAYPDPLGATGTLAERARSLLHANCSGCHRPGGPTPSSMDLRFSTPLAEANVCDVPPVRGDLGIVDARLIAPGDPDRSVLLARGGRRDAAGMPPLGSLVVDEAGLSLVREWISGLSTCP